MTDGAPTPTHQGCEPGDLDDELVTRAERLVRALEAESAPTYIIDNARNGVYDDFRSTQVNPYGQNLISHAEKLDLWDIARRAREGEFDAPRID